MKVMKYWLVVLGFLLLTGCTSNGIKVEGDQLSKIQKGVTTEQEVVTMLGKPTSVTTLPEKKVLHYDYEMNDQMGRSLAVSAASIVGGMVAGSLGSMVGSAAGRGMTGSGVGQRERLSVEIDPETGKVVTYRHQKSESGS